MIPKVVVLILLLLALGLLGKKAGILTPPRIDVLNKVAFYIALPALIFHSIYKRSLGAIFSLNLLLGFHITLIAILGLGWVIHRRIESRAKRSVAITQSYHGNIGYMGLPIVAMTLGETGGARAGLLLGFGSTTQILLTMSLLVYINSTRPKITDEIKKVIFNPVILSLFFGIAFSLLGLSLPEVLDEGVSWVGRSALPIALLGVGASIELRDHWEDLDILSSVLILKIILMPLLGFLLFTLLGAGTLEVRTGVLMLGMPTAVSTFIYTKEVGGDERLASLNISLTTISSILPISVLIFLFS